MIDRYRKGGMPVLAAGGSGKSYEFQLWDCCAGLTREQAETMELVAKETISSVSEKLASSNLAVVFAEMKRVAK